MRLLLGAVTYYSSHNYYDERNTNDRIVAAYLDVRKTDVPAWLAAEIAGSHKGALGTNQLLETYYETNKHQLRWEEVRILLRSIKYYSSHNYYDEVSTNDRIVASYLELSKHRIDPRTALEVAGSHKSPLGTNQLIESYFMANRQALDFEQVQYLLRGIRYYSSHNYYDEVRTKERIVSAAGCRLCP